MEEYSGPELEFAFAPLLITRPFLSLLLLFVFKIVSTLQLGFSASREDDDDFVLPEEATDRDDNLVISDDIVEFSTRRWWSWSCRIFENIDVAPLPNLVVSIVANPWHTLLLEE